MQFAMYITRVDQITNPLFLMFVPEFEDGKSLKTIGSFIPIMHGQTGKGNLSIYRA